MHYNYLILGGGIAGITAAETIRAYDENGTIAVVSKEEHLLYSRVLLPNYVKKRIRREQVFLRDVGDFEKKNIALFLGKEAVFLNPDKKEVKTKSGEMYSFDTLLIASGGTPRLTGIPSETKSGIFYLQTIDDADRIVEYVPNARKAVVIGGGFIGLEFLEILNVYKIPTTVILRNSHFFGGILDGAGGELMAKNFERFGINALYEDEVLEFSGTTYVSGVRTKKGKVIDCDFVGIGAGIQRNDDFLLGTGISGAPGRGAKTNEFLETSIPGIFAAGDIAEYLDVTAGRFHVHGNWTNAFLQGRAAGQNMVGRARLAFRNVPFYSITNLGMHITFLGEAEDAEETETVSLIDFLHNRYERFFIKKGLLVGAVLINMFHDKTTLAELIEKKVPVERYRTSLSDMNFDIAAVLESIT